MIKFGVPFGDVFFDNTPSAATASWELQNLSFAFKNEDDRHQLCSSQGISPSDSELGALRTNPTCRVTMAYKNPRKLLQAARLDELVPQTVKSQLAFNRLIGSSIYVGATATNEIATSDVHTWVSALKQGWGVKATVAKRLWRMVFGNPTFLVVGTTVDFATRRPVLFGSWGAPYPWYYKPEFRPPKKLADSIEKKQTKIVEDAKKSFMLQEPDLPDLTDEVLSMYESILDGEEEPIRNLRAYHEGPDGPWLCVGETSIHGVYDPIDNSWSAHGAYNYDGVNKFSLQADSNDLGGVDYAASYERVPRKFFKKNWAFHCKHNTRTRATKLGFWVPISDTVSTNVHYDIGTKRAGIEVFTSSLAFNTQKTFSLEGPVFEAGEVPGKLSSGGAGEMQLRWDAC